MGRFSHEVQVEGVEPDGTVARGVTVGVDRAFKSFRLLVDDAVVWSSDGPPTVTAHIIAVCDQLKAMQKVLEVVLRRVK